jgi:hypothetical protein
MNYLEKSMTCLILAAIVVMSLSQTASSQTVSTLISSLPASDALEVDKAGNVYATDYLGTSTNFFAPNGTTVDRITPTGIATVFGTGLTAPAGPALDDSGNIYVPSLFGGTISKFTPSGTKTILVSSISFPSDIHFGADRNLYVCDFTGNKVNRVTLEGAVSQFAVGAPFNGLSGITQDDDGNFYTSNFNDGVIGKITPTGVVSTFANVPVTSPYAVGYLIYSGGFLYATSTSANRIYKISLTGSVSVFAGTGASGGLDGNAAFAEFNLPVGIIASASGDTLYVGEPFSKRIRRITGINQTSSASRQSTKRETGFLLEPNYPNPFNPQTTIRFELGDAQGVSLKVYSLIGNEVATLISNQRLAAGSYQVSFVATNLASGVYLYRLQVGGFSQTRRMMLIK